MNNIEKEIRQFMQKQIQQLHPSKASLAKLRRGVGKKIGDMPSLLEFILPDENMSTYPEQEEQIETAIYTSLTLYALHQQGVDACVSTGLDGEETLSNKNSLGHAVRNLASKVDNEDTVLRRFDKVLTANSPEELAVHVRGLIGLMKQHNISLDYAAFAIDLYRFQQTIWHRRVVLEWGKDYYMEKRKGDKL